MGYSRFLYVCILSLLSLPICSHEQSPLPVLIDEIVESVVGIGIHTPMNSPSAELRGTGFVVGDGSHIVTNYHVVSSELKTDIVQNYAVFVGTGAKPTIIVARIVAIDPVHDLAILKINKQLKPVTLADDSYVNAGTSIFFTGFPIGAILGLYPATHVGIIAAITPDVIPSNNANQLSVNMLSRLKKPFLIYQLDATAYPGNSGSAVFDRNTSQVIAVINKVFVTEAKEAALSSPSGISYAIPIRYVRSLAKTENIDL